MADLRVPDLNTSIIAGRLTRDPDVRFIPSGQCIASLSIANTSYYKKQDGSRAERTTFVDVDVWGKQAEYIGEHLKKGRPVLVEGEINSDSWEDKQNGQKRSRTFIKARKVTPLDWDESNQQPARQQPQRHAARQRQDFGEPETDPDSIPF